MQLSHVHLLWFICKTSQSYAFCIFSKSGFTSLFPKTHPNKLTETTGLKIAVSWKRFVFIYFLCFCFTPPLNGKDAFIISRWSTAIQYPKRLTIYGRKPDCIISMSSRPGNKSKQVDNLSPIFMEQFHKPAMSVHWVVISVLPKVKLRLKLLLATVKISHKFV